MSNRYGAIQAAERLIERYYKSRQLDYATLDYLKYVRRNSTGFKALRLAGYLTGMGVFK